MITFFDVAGMDEINNGLGFRAMYQDHGKYVSPVHDDFEWPQEGIVYATCERPEPFDWDHDRGRVVPKNLRGISWHEPEEIPHEDCTCGFYTAYKFGPATLYEERIDQSVLFLVEAGWDTIYYDLGMRSAQLKVIACTGTEKRLSDDRAMDYFKIPFIQLETAKMLVDIQNMRVSLSVHPPFDYNPAFMDQTTAASLASQLPPLDYVEREDPILVDSWPFK